MKIKLILLLYIMAALALLLSSCVTYDKATGYLNAHRKEAAGYCAGQFPVTEQTTAVERIDTAAYTETIVGLQDYAGGLLEVAQRRNDSIAALKLKISILQNRGDLSQATADVLQAQVDGISKFDTAKYRRQIEAQMRSQIRPCKDSVITVIKENTAGKEQERLRADQLQGEKNSWQKWCLAGWGAFLVLLILGFFAWRSRK